MKSTALVAVLFIFLCSTTGWSEVKYFKIPPQEKKTDDKQSPGTQKPEKSKAGEATEKPETPVGNTTEPQAPPATQKGRAPARSVKQDQAPVQPAKQRKPSTAKPAKAKKQQPKGPYITSIQISSFQKSAQAEAEAERLKALGIDAFIRHEHVRGKGTWYRVYTGKFDSRRQALDYEQELKRKGIIHWSWIKRLPRVAEPEPATAQPARKQPGAAKPAARADRTPEQTPARKKAATASKPTRKSKSARKTSLQPAEKKRPPSQAARTTRKKADWPSTKKSTAKSNPKIKSIQSGRLSLGIRTGALLANGASDFVITETVGSDTYRYEFDTTKPLSGLSVSVRFNDRWSVDSIIEQVVLTNLDMQYMSLGPKMCIVDRGAFKTYIRSAMVYGNLAWDEAPGEFDSAMGLEAGVGVDLVGTRFNGSLEASYRSISFDYTAPSDGSATATDSQIDFSGFVLTGCVRIHF